MQVGEPIRRFNQQPDLTIPAPSVVAFAGKKGSGKDTAADVFVANGYTKVRMADGLKAMLRALLHYRGVEDDLIERYIEGDLKEEPCPALNGQTMRHAMQTLGTEWGRRLMHPNLWADATQDRITYCLSQNKPVVCADIRFPNEVEAIHFTGGKVFTVTRINHVSDDPHISETQVDQLLVDDFLTNNATSADAFRAQIAFRFQLKI
jgi:hypothetical protein